MCDVSTHLASGEVFSWPVAFSILTLLLIPSDLFYFAVSLQLLLQFILLF